MMSAYYFVSCLPMVGLAVVSLAGDSLPVKPIPKLEIDPPEAVKVVWSTSPGRVDAIEQSTDLNDWSGVDGSPVVATGSEEFITVDREDGAQFFRVLNQGEALPLLNRQSGISVGLSGVNTVDWMVEHSYHDASIADQVLYLRGGVKISLFHNANNSILKRDAGLPPILGETGLDGVPNNGDEGDIHWKIDRDMQSHLYRGTTAIPSWAPLYAEPFRFDALTFDGVLPVLGTTGDNGAEWGGTPRGTTERFAYGQLDAFGNEWHTLTYWDDDEPVYAAAGVSSHRQGASDGHWVYVCVNPVTPVLQCSAPTVDDQFYTTPIKTYHIPKTWEQTTWLTDGVTLRLFNLMSDEAVQFRVDEGPWQTFGGAPLLASELTTVEDAPVVLEYRIGLDGPVARRTLVVNPSTPAPSEAHGYLLWADDAERAQVREKVKGKQPFARSFSELTSEYYQQLTTDYSDVREGWRSGAAMASAALNNSFLANIDGPIIRASAAAMAKERLLRLARLEAVGFEQDINSATPSKDYLNELSQTIQQYADAAVAYDLLAASFRQTDRPSGMTPIEEIRIRDGLAEIAKTVLQVRGNWSFTMGSGDTHWAHGYELMLGIVAAAMPAYKTPYFGVSGGDFESVNDLSDEAGEFWNPFPHQGITWWAAATDPLVPTPGHPNVKAPLRAEALLTDNGFWAGPNDYKGDGDRYFTGPVKRMLVDLSYGGMANAECRVELVEMDGYEAPFVARTHVLDHIRRMRGDDARQLSVTNYIRRRLLAGSTPLTWNAATKTYLAGLPTVTGGSLFSFNNFYEAASLPAALDRVGTFLADVNRYYGYESGTTPAAIKSERVALFSPYALALCWDPSTILPHQAEPNHAPIIKPLLKHVVHPGEAIFKQLIVMDPDGDALSISVMGLPDGATYESGTRTIEWIPAAPDGGVHIATVIADDGTVATTAHFPMIVKADAPSGPISGGARRGHGRTHRP